MTDFLSSPDNWEWAMQEQPLTEREKLLRDQFVNEYLVDHDPERAAIRVGFQAEFAKDYAKRFMLESYVLRQIQFKEQADLDPTSVADYNKKRVIANLVREANYYGPGSTQAARVSANAKLAAIYGMDAPMKTESTVTHKGGVMQVPAIADVSAWEQSATASQEKLVSDVRH